MRRQGVLPFFLKSDASPSHDYPNKLIKLPDILAACKNPWVKKKDVEQRS